MNNYKLIRTNRSTEQYIFTVLITFTAHAYLPYSPQNLIKLHGKELITPPILHLLTFLSVNYQLILDQSLIHLPLPTITHLTTHPPFL